MLLLTVLAPISAGSEILGDGGMPGINNEEVEYRVILQYDAATEEIDSAIMRISDMLNLIAVNGHEWETEDVPLGSFGVDRPPENVLRPTVIHLPPLHYNEEVMTWIQDLSIVHHV